MYLQVHLAAFAIPNPQLPSRALPNLPQPEVIMFSNLLYAVYTGLAWLCPGQPTQQAHQDLTTASPPANMMPHALPPGLNLLNTSISELVGLLDNGTLSSESLVASYLSES